MHWSHWELYDIMSELQQGFTNFVFSVMEELNSVDTITIFELTLSLV